MLEKGFLEKAFSDDYFEGSKRIQKNTTYGKRYDQLLSRYRDMDIVFVEIGIGWGGCLQVWKKFFGSKAKIYGIDLSEEHFFEEDQIKCFKADQSDRVSLEAVPITGIDIFLDDASHVAPYEITTFEVFFPRIKSGGLYIVEDLGTNYRSHEYQGGYKRPGTFIEYAKDMIDAIHYNELLEVKFTDLFKEIESITVRPGNFVVEKRM